MAVENTTNIAGLNDTLPTGADMKSEGDDHLRLIKTVLKHTFAGFPGEVMLAASEAQGATVNDYQLTVAPTPAAYAANTVVIFRANHANTGAATLKLGGLAAKSLLNPEGTALRANAITATTWVMAVYDGTNFRMIGGGNSQAIYDYANQLAFQAALPSQVGNAGKFLRTDGSDASWGFLPPQHGQCRFEYVSATECVLKPVDGDGLIINGRQYRVPTAGVALPIADVGLSNSTWAYVYAKDDGAGGIGLEASATAHVLGPGGVRVKIGDDTRTLVGVAFKNVSGVFQDDSIIRGVSSWFNRTYKSANFTMPADVSTASTTPVQLIGAVTVWTWAGEGTEQSVNGRVSSNTVNGTTGTYLYLDGAQSWAIGAVSSTAGASVPVCVSTTANNLAEGPHSVTTRLAATGGTSTLSATQWIIARP